MQSQIELIDILHQTAQTGAGENVDHSQFKDEILTAFRIRKVETKFLELFSRSKISGTVHTCVGQELTGVALAKHLEPGDWITSNHRCHGHFIAQTGNWQGLIDELLGMKTGISKGIGSSQHLFAPGFISNGTQGSLLPVASGMGLAMNKRGKPNIAVSFIGEGTLGEGITYETMNLSSIFGSPHLIVLENNYYSQTTPQAHAVSGSIRGRAEAFGLEYFETDTWNLTDLLETCGKAVAHVRDTRRPAFLKIDTYRLLAHSKGDDDRERSEVEKYESLDLLNRLANDAEFTGAFAAIAKEIDDYSEERLLNKELYDYAEYRADQLPRATSARTVPVENPGGIFVKVLNEAYKAILLERTGIFIGEDIADPYGGAFKVTKGFQDLRPDQVFSTSISEAGLVGLAIGFAVSGFSAYAEIMFGDFIVNAMDQILNNASKFHHMYGKQTDCPVTIRTPMGARRGYGPTHSQSIEKLLLGLDNLLVAAPTSLCDPTPLIAGLEAQTCPKVVIENKTDYGNPLYQPPEDLLLEKIGGDLGTLALSPVGGKPTLAIVTYGFLARLVADDFERIFRATDRVPILIAPQLLSPLPVAHIERLIKRVDHVIVAEEGSEGFGWSDGVVSQLLQRNRACRYATLGADPVPIPSDRQLESLSLVSTDKIIATALRLDQDHD